MKEFKADTRNFKDNELNTKEMVIIIGFVILMILLAIHG